MLADRKGFTLIELIASLTLIGLLAAIAAMGVVTGMRGYVFAKENNAFTQQGQFISERMTREILEISAIDTVNSNDTCIRYKVDAVSANFRAIGIRNGNLELNVAAGADCNCPDNTDPGDLLGERVGVFDLDYIDNNGNVLGAPPASLTDLYGVVVAFRLDRVDGTAGPAFTFTVNPRNSGIQNGP